MLALLKIVFRNLLLDIVLTVLDVPLSALAGSVVVVRDDPPWQTFETGESVTVSGMIKGEAVSGLLLSRQFSSEMCEAGSYPADMYAAVRTRFSFLINSACDISDASRESLCLEGPAQTAPSGSHDGLLAACLNGI